MKVNLLPRLQIQILSLLIILLLATLDGCTLRQNNDLVFQSSTLTSLKEGDFEGPISVSEIKHHGNLGLGTFNGIDGEMIINNGVVYNAKYNGSLILADDSSRSPFVVVTDFVPDYNVEITGKTCEELEDDIKKGFSDLNHIRALRITGDFEYVKYRSVKKQAKPYPKLEEVVKDENIMTQSPSSGTAVGFWFPDDFQQVNVRGFHLHYINKNISRGGHLLDCKVKSAVVYIDNKNSLFISIN